MVRRPARVRVADALSRKERPMNLQEASLTPAQRVLVRLYRDTRDSWLGTTSYYDICEALQIEPAMRTAILKALLAAGHVKRRAEGHLAITASGTQAAVAALT
jgi:DNA-binding MarR family transcriptional regulator